MIISRIKWGLLAAGLVAAPVIIAPAPAAANVFYCSNCSTVWDQALQYAKEVETALNTAQQLQTQIQQYANMVQQGLQLPTQIFNSITGDLDKLKEIYNTGKSLADSAGNLDQMFRNQFKGFDNYLQGVGKSEFSTDMFKKWSETGFDNARTALRAAGVHTSSFASEDATLKQLVTQSQSATGRMQAIQAGNQIAAQQVQQLQKLRSMIATNITLQSNYIAQQTEQKATADAFDQKFWSTKPVHTNRNKEY